LQLRDFFYPHFDSNILIEISNKIKLNEKNLKFSFVRASGPGGQNVNKVSTAVQLKFDIENSEEISEEVKIKLVRSAGKRINNDGILIIEAKRFRTQEKNKQDAIDRLIKLIKKAIEVRKPRKKTKPTFASEEKRIENKKKRGQLKKDRKNLEI